MLCIESSNNMVPMFIDMVSNSDKRNNLAQSDADNKKIQKNIL